MIIGILLAITIAVSITSFLVILTGSSGVLRENLATGAVIGTSQAMSYASITLSISLIIIFFLVLILRAKKNKANSH